MIMSLEHINFKNLTPMLKHWYSVKTKYPQWCIAYRMGDFFEFFYGDAEKISKLLDNINEKRRGSFSRNSTSFSKKLFQHPYESWSNISNC